MISVHDHFAALEQASELEQARANSAGLEVEGAPVPLSSREQAGSRHTTSTPTRTLDVLPGRPSSGGPLERNALVAVCAGGEHGPKRGRNAGEIRDLLAKVIKLNQSLGE